MSRVAELEAMVQAAWTRGTQVAFGHDPDFSRDELRALLGVYADELQELGDPRGELVAHDLLRTPTTDDRARFEALVDEWLGPLARHPNINTRYGLVGVSIADTEPTLLQEFLETRGAPYLSSVSVFGTVPTVRSAIETLARGARPWLGALRICVPTTPIGITLSTPILSEELVEQLIAATPALYSLAIEAYAVMRDFPHPGLRSLAIGGHEDLGTLVGVGEPMPAVTHLDLQRALDRVRTRHVLSANLLPVSHWPALRRLDLSLNTAPHVFQFFHSLAIKRQLTHVRLPAFYTREDRDLLDAARADMPMLVELDMPPPAPWHANVPTVMLAFADREFIADPQALVPVMHHAYKAMPVEARLIWDDFWALGGDGELPARALADALAACGVALTDEAWRSAATALADAAPDAMVRISPL